MGVISFCNCMCIAVIWLNKGPYCYYKGTVFKGHYDMTGFCYFAILFLNYLIH